MLGCTRCDAAIGSTVRPVLIGSVRLCALAVALAAALALVISPTAVHALPPNPAPPAPNPTRHCTTPCIRWEIPRRLAGSRWGFGSGEDYEESFEASGTDPDAPVNRLYVDGCESGDEGKQIIGYHWTITDETHSWQPPATCSFSEPRPITDKWTIWKITLTVIAADGSARTTSKTAQFRDLLIASLGDSAASGEGDPDAPNGDETSVRWASPQPQEDQPNLEGARCDRSGRAATVKAAADIEKGYGSPFGTQTSVHFWHLACSGAQISDFSYVTTLIAPAESKICTFTSVNPSTSTNNPPVHEPCIEFRLAQPRDAEFIPELWVGDGSAKRWFGEPTEEIGDGRTEIVSIPPGEQLYFPTGTTVEAGNYGNGGILTPNDGIKRPKGPLCVPGAPPYASAPYGPGPCTHDAIPSQLQQLEELIRQSGGRKPDAVIMTIGANDLQWSSFIEKCYSREAKADGLLEAIVDFGLAILGKPPIEGEPEAIGDECLNSEFTTPILNRLAQLPARYDKLAKGLEAAGISPSTVYLTDYWDPTRDGGRQDSPYTHSCEAEEIYGKDVAPSARARAWGHENIVAPLNAAVARAASEHGWNVIGGIGRRFEGHGVCSTPEQQWVVSAIESLEDVEGTPEGGWHANETGQQVIAAIILEHLMPVLDGSASSAGGPGKPAVAAEAATKVTQTGATLTARVGQVEQQVTECWTEYGKTTGYGGRVPCKPAQLTVPTTVTASLSSLSPGTVYHFRIVASNANGTAAGADQTLLTDARTAAAGYGGSLKNIAIVVGAALLLGLTAFGGWRLRAGRYSYRHRWRDRRWSREWHYQRYDVGRRLGRVRRRLRRLIRRRY